MLIVAVCACLLPVETRAMSLRQSITEIDPIDVTPKVPKNIEEDKQSMLKHAK
jgi:hypothetical protein